MAKTNRVAPKLIAYALVGLILGAGLGFAASALVSGQSKVLFEASIMLYRIPTEGTEHAARDFISSALAKQGFLNGFIEKFAVEPKIAKLLNSHLTVFARDASSPNAELRLAGNDPAGLDTTLDSLAIYLTESLRSIAETDLQTLLDALNKEIAITNARYLSLMASRSRYGKLTPEVQEKIRVIASLVERKNNIELAQRYTFGPPPPPDTLAISQELEEQTRQAIALANTDLEHFEFASSLANAETELRTLRQTKQRLVIEFNQGTPLRVTGRAKIALSDVEPPAIATIIGACALIGCLLGGIAGSLISTHNTSLTGPSIESRLGKPVLGILPQNLTDFGERQLLPLADREPKRVAVAAVRSLNIALQLWDSEGNETGPVIVSELGKIHHAVHLIANLAIVMAEGDRRVLVRDESNGKLSSMLHSDTALIQNTSLHIQGLTSEEKLDEAANRSGIWLSQSVSDESTVPIPSDTLSSFDHVLILASDVTQAKRTLEAQRAGIGLVLCTDKSRISKIRKALGSSLHGVVLCGKSVEESIYGGETIKASQAQI